MTATVAPLHYRFPVDAMLKALKFHHQQWLAHAFAELLLLALDRQAAANGKERACDGKPPDAIVPLPLNRWRHAWRGFNQAEVIARALARQSGVPLAHLLVRPRRTRPQSGLDASARRRNLRGAFAARPLPVRGHLLLVDDVMTTGATIHETTRVLLRAGAERVTAVAVARAAPGDGQPAGRTNV